MWHHSPQKNLCAQVAYREAISPFGNLHAGPLFDIYKHKHIAACLIKQAKAHPLPALLTATLLPASGRPINLVLYGPALFHDFAKGRLMKRQQTVSQHGGVVAFQ